MAKTFTLDPLQDPRWQRFIERHPRASIFHTPGWLEALRRTYGYEPVVYTTASELEELANGLVLCRIESRLTGRRLVSLPFADHCDLLVDTPAERESLMASLIDAVRFQRWRSLQIRPLQWCDHSPCERNCIGPERSYYFHTLDIRSELAELFRNFHPSNIQRKIKRAEREDLTSEEGRSPELLHYFYELLIRTRRRHRVPPQPIKWFQNLIDCLGKHLNLRVAYHKGRPIASILTLSFKRTAYYKYGCTDERFHNLGGFQLLLWQAVQAEKKRDAQILDMGRSDIDDTGLISFKERWGCKRSVLTYYRYPPHHGDNATLKWAEEALGRALERLPDSLLTAVGGLLYPHIG